MGGSSEQCNEQPRGILDNTSNYKRLKKDLLYGVSLSSGSFSLPLSNAVFQLVQMKLRYRAILGMKNRCFETCKTRVNLKFCIMCKCQSAPTRKRTATRAIQATVNELIVFALWIIVSSKASHASAA